MPFTLVSFLFTLHLPFKNITKNKNKQINKTAYKREEEKYRLKRSNYSTDQLIRLHVNGNKTDKQNTQTNEAIALKQHITKQVKRRPFQTFNHSLCTFATLGKKKIYRQNTQTSNNYKNTKVFFYNTRKRFFFISFIIFFIPSFHPCLL